MIKLEKYDPQAAESEIKKEFKVNTLIATIKGEKYDQVKDTNLSTTQPSKRARNSL
jgi:hypothetical protein